MKTTIFLLTVLCASQASAQFNYSIGNYINQVEQSAWNAARYGAAINYNYNYNQNYNNYGYNGNNNYHRAKKTAAHLYQQRTANLAAKAQYERERREYILNTRLEHQEFLKQMKQNNPPKQGSITIEGKRYASYYYFRNSPEGREWVASHKK